MVRYPLIVEKLGYFEYLAKRVVAVKPWHVELHMVAVSGWMRWNEGRRRRMLRYCHGGKPLNEGIEFGREQGMN